jgi:hypothetical protein
VALKKKDNFPKSHELFWFIFLSGVLSVISFFLFLNFQSFGENIKNSHFNIYILGWAFFVPLGMLIAYLLKKAGSFFFKDPSLFNLLAYSSNFIFLLFLMHPYTWKFNSNWAGIAEFLSLQAGVFLTAKFLRLNPSQRLRLEKWLSLSMIFLLAVWVLSLSFNSLNFSIFNLLFCCAFVILLSVSLTDNGQKIEASFSKMFRFPPFGIEIFFYALALFYIACLTVDLEFPFDKFHHSYYLGPLADLRAGKALLVNINNLYGIMVFYFLSVVFKILPLGFKSFSFVITYLIVAQYFCFYFVTRHLFRSRLYSFICLTVLFMVNYFATMGHMTDYPSVGPLRFGFIYLLLVLVIMRNQRGEKKYFYIAEAAVIATAIFWGVEVGIYTFPPYLGLMLYESIGFEGGLQFDWKSFLRRISVIIGFCLLCFCFIYGDVYRRAHEWPHWSYYFDFVFTYKNGNGWMAIQPFGGWLLIVGTYVFSVFAILANLMKKKDPQGPTHFNAIVLVTFYGICQFFYFLGVSHPNNLFHVGMPAILLGAYWLYWLMNTESSPFLPDVKKSLFAVSAIAIGLYLQLLIPTMIDKLSHNLPILPSFFQRSWDAARDLPRDDDFAKTADLLMKKYSGNKREQVYLFGDRGIEVSMYTDRFNAFPFNDIDQASWVSPLAFKRAVNFIPPLSVGDYLYVTWENAYEGKPGFDNLEDTILNNLNREFDLRFIEQQKGITVYQVTAVNKTDS